MSAELSAEFATFEADQLLLDYLKERDCTNFTPVAPDPDAQYVRRTSIDLSKIGAMVGMPDAVINNVCEIDKIDNQQINQAFIGSCANGTLDDIEVAARVVSGRRVAPGVRLIVTPGSQDIFRRAIEAGFVSTLMEAGAVVTQSTCGACHGSHTGVIGPGEICITASTRNFKGRMGDPSAKIYMASPATVAASAIAGVITSSAKMSAT